VTPWAALTSLLPLSHALMTSVAHVDHAAMPVLALHRTVLHVLALVGPPEQTPLQLMEATNPQKPLVLMHPKPPLSAYAKSPRQLQLLTVPKENKHAATCS
jgi:hypothetical protein